MTGYEPLLFERDWNRANDQDWAKVLAAMPFFAGIPKRRLRKIAHEAQVREFAPGETVVAVGAPADWFYVVLGGEAKVGGRPGARSLRTGDFFGEIALLNDSKRTASVISTGDLHVLRMPRQTFLELLEEEGVGARLLDELGGRVRRVEQSV